MLDFYGKGPEFSYGGEEDGNLLAFDAGGHPGALSSWRVERRGTTHLTLTVADDRTTDEVGVITVIVE
jgi:hypothetical protein